MEKYDPIVIGSGPAGEKAAVKDAYFGYKIALVEKNKEFGGSEVSAVIPSQILRELALCRKTSVKFEDYLERKKNIVAQRQQDMEDNLIQHQIDLYRGMASFENAHTIKIVGEKEETICSEYIMIATGSCAIHPEGIAFDQKFIHDTRSIVDLDHFPKSICVVGASVLGFEFATLFSRLGSKVCFINSQSTVLPFLDQEMINELIEVMKEESIEVDLEKSVKEDHVENDQVMVTFETGEKESYGMMLYSCNRSANTRQMNCEKIGLYHGHKDVIEVDEQFASSIPHIFAVGDAIGFPSRASTRMEQGRIAVSHMFHTKDLEVMAKEIPYTIYSLPEIATVGISEEKAKELKIDYCVGKAQYDHLTKGRIRREKYGFLKLIFHKINLKILGVHIIGTDASELIHYGTVLVEGENTITQLIGRVFNDPSFHDLYKYAAYDGLGRLSGHKIKSED